MITAGVLVAISVAGTWDAAGGGIAIGEADQYRVLTTSQSRRVPLVIPADCGERIVSEKAIISSSPNRFLRSGEGETGDFRNHPRVSKLLVGALLVEKMTRDGRETDSSGFRGWMRALLVNGEGIHSGEDAFLLPALVVNDSAASGRVFGARPEAAAELSGFFSGKGERTVPVSSEVNPRMLTAGQQGRTAPTSPGAEAEEPARPGLVAGLLGVVAAAGALVGRYAGYPVRKRKDRK